MELAQQLESVFFCNLQGAPKLTYPAGTPKLTYREKKMPRNVVARKVLFFWDKLPKSYNPDSTSTKPGLFALVWLLFLARFWG